MSAFLGLTGIGVPSVAQVTKGGLSDPNAPAPGSSGKPGDKKQPKKK